MKRIILFFFVLLAIGLSIQAINRIVTLNDSINGKTVLIELRDTNINGKVSTDTFSITTYDNDAGSQTSIDEWKDHDDEWDWDWESTQDMGTFIAVISILSVFGLPVLVIFIVFYFRYKNRKAKYRLVEQALARGETIPANFFEKEKEDMYIKGIRNVCSGIGLFIFLWALIGFAIGCVGLLIMCTGIGQIIIYRTQRNDEKEKK